MLTGMWVALDPQPVYYIPGDGRMWLVDRHREGQILKDCLIYEAGRGMDLTKLKQAYEPHYFKCSK